MTNDKTVTMSRELAERLFARLESIYRREDVEELRALLAAPAVERQEPVAYRYRDPNNAFYTDRKVWEPITLELGNVYLERKARAVANNNRYPEDVHYSGIELEPLYTSPPAPVAVVPFKLISLPPSLMEHHAFEVLQGALAEVGVKIKDQTPCP